MSKFTINFAGKDEIAKTDSLDKAKQIAVGLLQAKGFKDNQIDYDYISDRATGVEGWDGKNYGLIMIYDLTYYVNL